MKWEHPTARIISQFRGRVDDRGKAPADGQHQFLGRLHGVEHPVENEPSEIKRFDDSGMYEEGVTVHVCAYLGEGVHRCWHAGLPRAG